eukprot:scaffold9657_cov103-Isochrysis_galbana.AAC.6
MALALAAPAREPVLEWSLRAWARAVEETGGATEGRKGEGVYVYAYVLACYYVLCVRGVA